MKATALMVLLTAFSAADAYGAWGCGNPYCVMCYGSSARAMWQARSVTEYQPSQPQIESTPQVVVDAMLLEAQLTPEDLVYDLGCGDGRICKTAAARWGARAVGIEIDSAIAEIAKSNCQGLPVRIIQGDARRYLLSNATVVTMYLDKDLMAELVPKVEGTARVIVSYSHPIPGHLSRRVMIDGKYPIYICTLDRPARTGRWRKIEL